jgi:hypothetical protein
MKKSIYEKNVEKLSQPDLTRGRRLVKLKAGAFPGILKIASLIPECPSY